MAEPSRILVIEDEPAIADTLVYALRTEGFVPEWRANGRDGLAAFAQQSFALVILDVGLPDGSGFDLCRELRTRTSVPVLFLTARNAEIDRVVGLELGGDDYVTKPFSPREVTARVRAILRRTASSPSQEGVRLRNDVFAVDDDRKTVRFHGVALELTRCEYRLLKALLARPGRVYSRDELMTQAWEDPGASLDRTVDAHIKTLRAKLRAATGAKNGDEADEVIRTHRGEGYSVRIER
jgi:two-component system catabolic regulation response regulator CreB